MDFSFYSGKKVLITGGLGFLGSNLAHQLVVLGAKVTLLDCFLENHGANLFNIQEIQGQVQVVKGDIRDLPLLEKIIPGQDVLFNIAAQTSHTDSINNPLLDVDINNRGQIQLLETCKKWNPSVCIVYCSTRAVYGAGQQNPVNEMAPLNPMDIYSINKLSGEYYHKLYHSVFGLKTVVARLANGYGPRAQMKGPSFGILNWFARLAIDNQEIKVF